MRVDWKEFVNARFCSYPRMNKPERAGIRRRLVGSRTDAKANLAAVNARNDSVVFVRIRWVICKWGLPLSVVDVGSIPSKSKFYLIEYSIKQEIYI